MCMDVYDGDARLPAAGTAGDRTHVLAHTAPNPAKLNHTIFSVPKYRVLALVDEAWSKRGSPEPDDLGAYVIPINRVVGTAGETAIRIVVRPGTNLILSAYPVPP